MMLHVTDKPIRATAHDIPPDDYAKLKRIAEGNRWSISTAILEAIREYVKTKPKSVMRGSEE